MIHFVESDYFANSSEINRYLKNKDIFGFGFTGHGVDHKDPSGIWTNDGKFLTPFHTSKRLNHKLGFLWLAACNTNRPDWRGLISENGSFFGVNGYYYVGWTVLTDDSNKKISDDWKRKKGQ